MKGVLKVSKEQVIEVERYCDEHGVTRKQRIAELGLSLTSYYYTHGLLSDEDLHGGQFLPIMPGSGVTTHGTQSCKRRSRSSVQPDTPMTIEIRTSKGSEMRLTGSFNAEMLRTILGNV